MDKLFVINLVFLYNKIRSEEKKKEKRRLAVDMIFKEFVLRFGIFFFFYNSFDSID